MRALLQERQWQREQGLEQAQGSVVDQGQAQEQGLVPGKNTLYFGCQKSAVDYIYRDEIEAMTASKVMMNMSCCS